VAPLSGWPLFPRVCAVGPFAKGLHSWLLLPRGGPLLSRAPCYASRFVKVFFAQTSYQVSYRCCLSSNASSLVMWSSSSLFWICSKNLVWFLYTINETFPLPSSAVVPQMYALHGSLFVIAILNFVHFFLG